MKINVKLDEIMLKNKVRLNELALRIGITEANLSILKNGKAKAIRFSTLMALCKELNCQPGDLLEFEKIINNGIENKKKDSSFFNQNV